MQVDGRSQRPEHESLEGTIQRASEGLLPRALLLNLRGNRAPGTAGVREGIPLGVEDELVARAGTTALRIDSESRRLPWGHRIRAPYRYRHDGVCGVEREMADNVCMIRFATGCAFVLALMAGCAQPHGTDSSGVEVDHDTKNLFALRMVYADHVEVVVCKRPWTVWIEWMESSRVFRLYDKSSRSVTETNDFDLFLTRLAALPRNIEIERLDTCGSPRTYAMPDDAWERLSQVLKDGGRSWAFDELSEQDRRILCICETVRLEFPRP